MNRRHLWISIAAIAVFGFLLSRDLLARATWQKYHSPAAALALASRDTKLLMRLGNYYFNGGAYDLRRAKRAYEKALRVDSKILWGHYQLARIYFTEGKFEDALSEINRELEFNPENLRSLYVRGLIYGYRGSLGDLEKAEDDFRRFTFWAPKEWAGYNDLAWVLAKQKKYSEAKAEILRAFREMPDEKANPWLWNALGVAELNLEEYAGAKASFEKAREFAENLTAREWRRAYPGNNPADAESGLTAFIKAIEENILRSGSVNNSL